MAKEKSTHKYFARIFVYIYMKSHYNCWCVRGCMNAIHSKCPNSWVSIQDVNTSYLSKPDNLFFSQLICSDCANSTVRCNDEMIQLWLYTEKMSAGGMLRGNTGCLVVGALANSAEGPCKGSITSQAFFMSYIPAGCRWHETLNW